MAGREKELGKRAEQAAWGFLEKKGFRILETNYTTRAAEIDIIARQGDFLVFVEVKSRTSLRRGSPREAVTRSKQKKIVFGAACYIRETRADQARVRFDVVAVLKKGDRFDIEHIENAFQPEF
ncbi:MAG TPA: YraN family protein [Desulfobacteraceae bacterium]|nr:YraN family protein [Desulfobacteraceae bacterium]